MAADAEKDEATDAGSPARVHLHRAAEKAIALTHELHEQAKQLKRSGVDPAFLIAAAESARAFAEQVVPNISDSPSSKALS